MYVLETRGLRKDYGAEGEVCVHALRGVDLQVRKGELLAIMALRDRARAPSYTFSGEWRLPRRAKFSGRGGLGLR